MRRLMLAAALLATASCRPNTPPATHPALSAPQSAHRPFSAISTGMPDCKPKPTPDQISRVVRIVIPDPFDPATVMRDVKYKDEDPAVNDDDDQNNLNGTPVPAPPAPTPPPPVTPPFDIDLTKLDKNDGLYAMIRIIMKDQRYSFYKWKDIGGNWIKGVGAGTFGNPMNFCGADIRNGLKWPVAVFYVPIPKKSANDDVLESFNFGIVSNLNTTTPIFVDPSIKNNG